MDDPLRNRTSSKINEINMIGISSAHFNNADLNVFEKWNAYDAATLKPVEESQRLNEEILGGDGSNGYPTSA